MAGTPALGGSEPRDPENMVRKPGMELCTPVCSPRAHCFVPGWKNEGAMNEQVDESRRTEEWSAMGQLGQSMPDPATAPHPPRPVLRESRAVIRVVLAVGSNILVV